MTDLWDGHTVSGVINNNPVVWTIIVISRTVTYCRPEQWVTLCRWPHALQHLVRYVSVAWQPTDNVWRLQRQLPLQPHRRIPEVVTQFMPSYALQCHKSADSHEKWQSHWQIPEVMTQFMPSYALQCHKSADNHQNWQSHWQIPKVMTQFMPSCALQCHKSADNHQNWQSHWQIPEVVTQLVPSCARPKTVANYCKNYQYIFTECQ